MSQSHLHNGVTIGRCWRMPTLMPMDFTSVKKFNRNIENIFRDSLRSCSQSTVFFFSRCVFQSSALISLLAIFLVFHNIYYAICIKLESTKQKFVLCFTLCAVHCIRSKLWNSKPIYVGRHKKLTKNENEGE